MEEFFSDRLFTALERNEPTAGMVLVAAPGMLSDEFARSVVLSGYRMWPNRRLCILVVRLTSRALWGWV